MSMRDKLAAWCYAAGCLSAIYAGFLTSRVAGLAVLAAVGLLTALLLGWRR
jgi:hypothetical protein